MTLNIQLNGTVVELTSPSEYRLSTVLKDQCRGIHLGCGQGKCGSCLILVDGLPRYSCQMPFFSAKNKKITTIEGILNSQEFQDILKGFKRANLDICDFCAPSRVLSIYYLLSKSYTPDQGEVEDVLSAVNCSCSSYDSLQRGIFFSIEEKNRRLHG